MLDDMLKAMQSISSTAVAVASNSRQAVDAWNGVVVPVVGPATPNPDPDLQIAGKQAGKVWTWTWPWTVGVIVAAAGLALAVGWLLRR